MVTVKRPVKKAVPEATAGARPPAVAGEPSTSAPATKKAAPAKAGARATAIRAKKATTPTKTARTTKATTPTKTAPAKAPRIKTARTTKATTPTKTAPAKAPRIKTARTTKPTTPTKTAPAKAPRIKTARTTKPTTPTKTAPAKAPRIKTARTTKPTTPTKTAPAKAPRIKKTAAPAAASVTQDSASQGSAGSEKVVRAGMNPLIFGIDIGGSGIKGAPVDLNTGALAMDRKRIKTPDPSTPAACALVVAEIVSQFEHAIGSSTPVGITFPGVVWDGVTLTAANVDDGWINTDADGLFEEALKRPVTVLNDAQAAVLAECHYGAARGVDGLVLMLTFGTGIGSGLAYRGVALPGIELGHLRMRGDDAEHYAAASAKEKEGLSWKDWAVRVNDYLARVEKAIWPELIIIGGGLSDKPEKFLPRLRTRAPITTAKLANHAGIVGAAIAATSQRNIHRN